MSTQTQPRRRGNGNRRTPPPQKGKEKFVLCGHINLHKSDACQAQFVHYLERAMPWLDFDGNSFTNDTGYPHKRGNRPVTVSQWNRQRAAGTLGGSDGNSNNDSNVTGTDPNGATNSSVSPSGPAPHLNPNLGQNTQFQGQLNDFLKQMRNNPPPQHPKGADVNLAQGFIFAVQEPHVSYGKLTGVGNTINIFANIDSNDKDTRVRAALILSKKYECLAYEGVHDP